MGPVTNFGETKGRNDFLKLLKYMIPYPSNPLAVASPERLGGDRGLGGPMGPMTPGMLSTKYGTVIISGPMDVTSNSNKRSSYAEEILGG